jgi:hypothetical protein
MVASVWLRFGPGGSIDPLTPDHNLKIAFALTPGVAVRVCCDNGKISAS